MLGGYLTPCRSSFFYIYSVNLSTELLLKHHKSSQYSSSHSK
uniref:Uncharacterized protein n=1 Tax=Arundo donax TaxID=35708 RepID=A0A0A8Z843_ARUDO